MCIKPVALLLVLILSDFVSMLKLAQIYQDNMVLQRAPHKARLWGYGSVQMTHVSLMLYGKVYSTDTSKVNWTNLYVWTIELEPIKADKKPIDIEITETTQTGMIIHTVLLKNVLFGDVWICGGQSNMNFELHKAFEWDRESKIVESFEHLRVTCVAERNGSIALNDLDHDPLIAWSMPSQVSLHNFSAVCWYFGKELSTRLDVPIGLIENSAGGTVIENWIDDETLKACDKPEKKSVGSTPYKQRSVFTTWPHSSHWNSMLNPLTSLSIFGIVWYHGESNINYNLDYYACNFVELVRDWRHKWFIGTNQSTRLNFPFGFVQLTNRLGNIDKYIGPHSWLRFHQTGDYGYVPNPNLIDVFMATAIDLGEWPVKDPVHSRYKRDVGQRLANGALHIGYGLTDVEFSAPRVTTVEYNDDEESLKIGFVSVTNQRFKIENRNDTGFEVCCDRTDCLYEQHFHWIKLSDISISNKGYSSNAWFKKPIECKTPLFVRYLWQQKPCEYKRCPLFSAKSELPITPFIYQVVHVNTITRNYNFPVGVGLFIACLMIFWRWVAV